MANPTFYPAVTTTPTALSSTCDLLSADRTGYAVRASCTGTPPTTTNVFQHGCIMFQTDTATGKAAIYQNEGSTTTPSWKLLVSSATPVTALGVNYVVGSGSSANTLVGTLADANGVNVTVAAGLRVLFKSDSTLQVGANTFNLNSHGADPIVTNSGKNLKTAYVSGAMLDMVFDGTNWQLINSTTLVS